jgi:purine-binding chemotaxis protein CheW
MNDLLLAPKSAGGAAPVLAENGGASFVTFKIAYQQFALPLAVALEIIRLPALVALAGAPPTLCGLLNLRGRYLPILDARALMGAPVEYDLNSQIVIAGRGTPELGLLVDQVRDVCTVPADRVAPINRTDVAPFLTSVFDLAEESVLVFDLAALLTFTPRKAQSKAKKRPRRTI